MNPDVRTFRAASMAAALELVRNELGGDAVILHTRQVEGRSLLPFQKARPTVEITAALGIPTAQMAPTAGSSERIANTSRERDTNTERPVLANTRTRHNPNDDLLSPPPLLDSAPGAGRARKSGDRPPLRSELAGAFPRLAHAETTPANNRAPVAARADLAESPSAARSTNLSSDGKTHPAVAAPAATAHAAEAADRDFNPHSNENLARRLERIEDLLAKLVPQSQHLIPREVSNDVAPLYARMVRHGVDSGVAQQLLARLKQQASPEQLANESERLDLLSGLIRRDLRIAPPIAPVRGRRKVVALVGPTGVGKTTTIAKLAANLRLREGVKMGLVTVDTYRIAAVEQLRTYAEIIDLPMKVVTNSLEMKRALAELEGLDLVVIDTAGRSPSDELKIQELKTLLAEAQVDEVHLVLSLTSSLETMRSALECFAPVNVSSVILTKLDEAVSPGIALSFASACPHPISYLTTGQDVPADIEPAQADRIARRVLGIDL